MTKEERFKQLMESGWFEFLKNIPKDRVWELFFAASYVMNDLEEQEPCEKSINKTFEFGNHKGVGVYWNQQTDTVELPKAVFEYILRQVPTEEQELCDTSDSENPNKSDIPTSCDDTISREAVEKIVNKYIDGSFEWGAMLVEIKKLPSIKTKSIECDTISREAVKNEIKCWIGSGEHRYAMAEKFLFDRINDLPGVSSRKGHWVIERDPNTGKDMSYHCSNCYEDSGFYTTSASKYCPNCGMLMNLQPIEENEVTE